MRTLRGVACLRSTAQRGLPRPPPLRPGTVCRAARQQGSLSSSSEALADDEDHVRVIHYPDGFRRILRYPQEEDPQFEEEQWRLENETGEAPVEDWHHFDECDLWGSSCNDVLSTEPPFLQEQLLSEAQAGANPSTSFDWDAFSVQTANLEHLVRNSYEVLSGSPWLKSRTLFVLGTSLGTMHTLQVRYQQADVQDELAKLLKRPELASALSYSQMKDGVVAFETAEDAARYAEQLEADVDGEIDVLGLDSKQLFLNTSEVGAVVVYVRADNFTPMPYQLANVLRTADNSP